MSKAATMKVPLREMPCDRTIAAGKGFVREAISGLPLRAALEPAADGLAGEVTANLSFYMQGDNVFVRGKLSGWIELACSRCVGPVRVALEEKLAVSFLPKARVPDQDVGDETDVSADDIDLYPYTGEELDLTTLIREQIIMAVPYAPLCGQDCKGLCTVCGADLNEKDCGCDRDVIDPRLAALQSLKV